MACVLSSCACQHQHCRPLAYRATFRAGRVRACRPRRSGSAAGCWALGATWPRREISGSEACCKIKEAALKSCNHVLILGRRC